MVRTTTTRGPAPRRLEHIDRAGLVPSRGGRPFRPTVKLDRSQVRDQRLNTPVETRAGWDGRQRLGMPPYMFPISWQRRINPSVRPPKGMGQRRFTRRPVIRGGAPVPSGALTAAFTIGRRTGPFNPNARLVPGNSVVRASGIKFNAVPRPGDLRTAAVSLSRGRIPEGSLLNDIVTAIRQPMIRTFGAAGGAHTAGLNIRTQMGLLQRQRLHAQRTANVNRASDNFRFGSRQIGRLTARRRGTPARGGQPTIRPPR